MLIKKKSLLVALLSGFVISSVLVLTLVGYLVYVELKGEESKRSYQAILKKINTRSYVSHIQVTGINARIGDQGPLKGKPLVEGMIENKGYRDVSDLLMKIKFLDSDGAAIYEVLFHPQEPALGSAGLVQLSIPYLSPASRVMLKPGQALPFKKVLNNCPREIVLELDGRRGFAKGPRSWSGKFAFEIIAIDL